MRKPQEPRCSLAFLATYLKALVPMRKGRRVTLEAGDREALRDKEVNDLRKEKTRIAKIGQKPLRRNGGGRQRA